MKLYQLASEFVVLQAEIEDADGEITPEIAERP